MSRPSTVSVAAALLLGTSACLGGGAAPAPDTSAGEQGLLSNVRQLIFEGLRSGEGYFSADGTKMIFQSEREPGNPFYQIYLLDRETGDIHRVSPGIGKTTCAWIHPAGDRVLFASTHEDPEALAKQREELKKRAAGTASRYSWSFDERYDIFESDLAGHHLRKLTDALGYDAEGSWSPDGQTIVFASNRRAYQGPLGPEEQKIFDHDKSYFMEIYRMDADGGHVRRLTDAPGYDGGPFFSADGRRIVWRRFSTDGVTAEIWTMNADGSDQRPITHLGVMSWAPFFHPSGDYIIFANNAQGFANFELYLIDSAGQSPPVRVTYTAGFDGLPVFSPDGTQLAWTSARTADHKPQIFIADWNDAAARALLGLTHKGSSATHRGAPAAPPLGKLSAAISPQDLRAHVSYLASPALGGRLTGSAGERLATDYVASVFRHLGLEPAGDGASYFQAFELTAGVSLGPDNRLSLQSADGAQALAADRDWRPLPFSRTGAVDAAPVVFAGYGIVAPATPEFPAYDAYAGLDVKDKWVMVLRYMPENITAAHRQHLAQYFEMRYKAMVARDKGARGLIVVSGPNAQVKEQLVTLATGVALAGASLTAISVTDALAQRLLDPGGHSLKALQDTLDAGDPVPGFTLEGVRLGGHIALEQEKRLGRNVLGRLRAGAASAAPVVMIGAHVDHIGNGVGFDSLARRDELGKVHPGADDNASGVAALLEIAQYLSDQKAQNRLPMKRDIIFAAWSGEEMGLLGSGHYVRALEKTDNPPVALSSAISAYLNMDMVGRLDRHLYLQGVGSSSLWKGEIERRNIVVGLPIVPQNDSYLPTDATSFYLEGVPVLSAFTGAHPEYNTPRDTAETLNYDGTARVAKFMALMTRALATRDQSPDYIAMKKPAGAGTRRNLRAYLGTIPEYGDNNVKGVKLNGVATGGPAARAGLRAGDVIVAVAGRKVENVYDYTFALNAVKVGQPVELRLVRDGAPLTLTVIPESRE